MPKSASRTDLRKPGGTQTLRHEIHPKAIPGFANAIVQSQVERWETFSSQVHRCRRRPGERAIHDLRVSTRRLLAVVEILRALAPGFELIAIRKQLQRHLEAFSALRDLQVQLIAVRALASRFPLMKLLRTMLLVREKTLLKDARREILAIQLDQMNREFAELGQRLPLLFAKPPMDDVSRHVVLGILGKAFARAESRKTPALSGSIDHIHKFRIAFKKFRYTTEAMQLLLPGVTRRLLTSMNAYQTRMGEIHDVDVLLATVNRFARHHAPPSPIRSVGLKVLLINKRTRLVSRFLANAGEFDQYWTAIFNKGV